MRDDSGESQLVCPDALLCPMHCAAGVIRAVLVDEAIANLLRGSSVTSLLHTF
ncbi:MAG: hypothetical protein KME27_21725 [Lyngbya sp. HA4199-MV5]|nr:hypothetical protein [Lyngbya sp. HA4199-MV5]